MLGNARNKMEDLLTVIFPLSLVTGAGPGSDFEQEKKLMADKRNRANKILFMVGFNEFSNW